ncbi:MAG: cupin domain-containing protein [Methanosarcinaceae archaeon]
MKIVDVLSAPLHPNPHGVNVSMIYDTEDAQAVHITLQPGEALKLHATPVDVFFYILEGRGIVEIGKEQEEVVADHLIESPARIPHRLLNKSDSVFRFLVVKTPRPENKTRVL